MTWLWFVFGILVGIAGFSLWLAWMVHKSINW